MNWQDAANEPAVNSGRLFVTLSALHAVFLFPEDVEIVGVKFHESGHVELTLVGGKSLPVSVDPAQRLTANYSFERCEHGHRMVGFTGFGAQ